MSSASPRLIFRLAVLALATVVIQETAVSQISIFGVSADLSPLVVMSVGLLTGSLPGAIMGFATGLLVDTVLVQTLGVTSLLCAIAFNPEMLIIARGLQGIAGALLCICRTFSSKVIFETISAARCSGDSVSRWRRLWRSSV